MKRLLILAAVLATVGTACANVGPVPVDTVGPGDGGGTTTPPPGPGTGEPPPTTQPTGSPSGETMTFEVWLSRDEALFMTRRTVAYDPGIGRASIEALLAGPTARESATNVGTAIPAGTRFLGLSIDGGVATVDLSGAYESGGGSFSMAMRLAQVVYTLTQFDSIDAVSFRLDGRPVDVFSGEGLVLDHPVGRDDYADLFPVILVEDPIIGQRFSSGDPISGVANVFEANVTVEIRDAADHVLARGFTTATCGTGCYGDFTISFDFDVDGEQPGTIVVHDDDAAGTGTPPHVVIIPVTLVP
ncbi:MAG: GerMN domain-containing protein [Actinobacteria bacterium]|nr:GerMN domain-containing protein [Actinomycetota bacterium]